MQARDVIRAIPAHGEVERYWRSLLGRGRLAVLSHHLNVRGSLGEENTAALARQLLALPEAVRLDVAASSEFGAWISEVRDAFERGDRVFNATETEEIVSRIGAFLILPLLQGGSGCTTCIPVSAVEGGIVAVPGTPLFFKLRENVRTATCVIGNNAVTFEAEGSVALRFSRDAMNALLNGDGISPHSLRGLAPGAYRLPEFRLPGVFLGLPVNTMLTVSRLRMARALDAGDAPDELMTFGVDASRFVDDVNQALSTIVETWPEMGKSMPLHTHYVVPIVSDRVFSYSELNSPNSVFLRADPRNPLWYLELLIHETCHVWLASLMELIPIVDPDQNRRLSSPWRADPRPLIGVLFGAHAFAMVARCLLLLLEQGTPHEDMIALRLALEAERLARGYALLHREGAFSQAGEIFMADLGRVVEEVTSGVARAGCVMPTAGGPALDPVWPTVL